MRGKKAGGACRGAPWLTETLKKRRVTVSFDRYRSPTIRRPTDRLTDNIPMFVCISNAHNDYFA